MFDFSFSSFWVPSFSRGRSLFFRIIATHPIFPKRRKNKSPWKYIRGIKMNRWDIDNEVVDRSLLLSRLQEKREETGAQNGKWNNYRVPVYPTKKPNLWPKFFFVKTASPCLTLRRWRFCFGEEEEEERLPPHMKSIFGPLVFSQKRKRRR